MKRSHVMLSSYQNWFRGNVNHQLDQCLRQNLREPLSKAMAIGSSNWEPAAALNPGIDHQNQYIEPTINNR